jgi:hypothetical protein
MWLFDGAMANGVTNGATESTTADAIGTFSVASAGGQNTTAFAEGNLNLAAVQGNGSTAEAGTSPADIGNVALNLGTAAALKLVVVQLLVVLETSQSTSAIPTRFLRLVASTPRSTSEAPETG